MTTLRLLISLAMLGGLVGPTIVSAQEMSFKLKQPYSRATFKSDGPLETFVGNTANEGLQGALKVDPAKPAGATGTIRVDMNTVRTGIDKRDADMRKDYLNTEVEANRWVTFEVKGIEIAGPLVPGQAVPAKVRGILTAKQKSVERVADATVTYIKLTPDEVKQQERFGFGSDNIKVRAKLGTTYSDHGITIPQLLFMKVANDLQLETDLVFIRE